MLWLVRPQELSRKSRSGGTTQAEPRKGVGGLWPSFVRSIIFRRNSVTLMHRRRRRGARPSIIRNVRKSKSEGLLCSPVERAYAGSAGSPTLPFTYSYLPRHLPWLSAFSSKFSRQIAACCDRYSFLKNWEKEIADESFLRSGLPDFNLREPLEL